MSRRGVVLLTAALAAIFAVSFWRLRPPAPLPATAPASRFSAERAIAILRTLLADERPHPVGSDANRALRDRVMAQLQSLGYAPQVQLSFVCNTRPACAWVENIVALPPGPGDVVLLTAHYDSVPAGPGASDDGAGVAILMEVGRALGPQPGIGYLITDGEEAGLLGAEAFVKTPVAKRVAMVINVENRGTSGPSFLFETSRGNGGLIRHMRAMARPFASSLFYTVYDLLPNDTDMTVFKRAGFQGLNFAAIGGLQHYHTAQDNLANVDARTVQHHGQNILAVARSLAPGGAPASRKDAVFFDVLGFGIVSWPSFLTIWIAIVSAIVLVLRIRPSARGFATFLGTIVVAGTAAWALAWMGHVRGRPAHPELLVAAMWLVGIAAAYAAMARGKEAYASVSVVLHVAAIALALTLPGVAYLFLVPAVVSLLAPRVEAAGVAAGMLIFPLALLLYTALGRTALIPIALLIAIVFALPSTMLPFDRRVPIALGIAAGVLTLVTAVLPPLPPRKPVTRDLVLRSEETTRVEVPKRDIVEVQFASRLRKLRVNGVEVKPGIVRLYGTGAVLEFEPATNAGAYEIRRP